MKTEASKKSALTKEVLQRMDAYWRAANYLSVGQIYLLDNPLLQKPLTLEHIKARLLGHWGTTPGLNFVYVHLNRIIKKHDLSMMYIAGPGHGGPEREQQPTRPQRERSLRQRRRPHRSASSSKIG